MDITETRRIRAGREVVFRSLNDPEVLRRAIPGCVSMERVADSEFEAEVAVKVGPVKANFKGKVELSDIVEPESYTISGSGSGGAAGVASGEAKVRLEDAGGETDLIYEVTVKPGGKLAQLGNRVIKSVAKSQADKFFTAFGQIVEGGKPEEAPKPDARKHRIISPWVWVATFAALAAAYYVLTS